MPAFVPKVPSVLGGRRGRIFVFNARDAFRSALCAFLEGHDFWVAHAGDIPQVICVLAEIRSFDVLVVDLEMDYELTRGVLHEFRSRDIFGAKLVVLDDRKITETHSPLDSLPGLVRPFDFDRLLRAVESAIATR